MKPSITAVSYRDTVGVNHLAQAKSLIFILFFSSISFFSLGQGTTPVSFTTIPFSDPDIISPFRGAEQWHDDYTPNLVGNPTESSMPPVTYDAYSRSGIAWWQLETSQGVYNWTAFDNRINDAISKRRKFSFNIMALHPGSGEGPSANGVYMTYPLYLHNLMQQEVSTSRDWITPLSNHWVPNYNSPNFQARLTALLNAIATHINNTSYNGVPYRNAIGYVDIGIFGSWGEWNHSNVINKPTDYPSGRLPTAQAMNFIIDAHITAFPNYPLVIPHAAYDGNRLSNTQVPPEVGYHALTASNNWGKIGWKRMNWGWTYDYINYSLEKNPTVYNGMRFDTATMNRYKYALICGEGPCGGTAAGGPSPFWDLPRQVRFYHASMIGNGNWCGEEDQGIRGRDSIRMAFKSAGYRMVIEGGSVTTNLLSGAQFTINLNWKNVGVAPIYENWNVTYELRNSAGTAVWTGNSSLKLKLFQPQATATPVQDNFTLPSNVPAGNYSLVLIIRDPNNYRYPLPLAIRGRNTDGSYLIRTLTVGTGTVVNGAPVASAGNNMAITLPTNSVTLDGSASRDADGTIASYAWSQVGGPGTASFTNNDIAKATAGNLIQGTYTFRLTVKDNLGASSTDDVTVTVNPAVLTPPTSNVAPVASAGNNQTITLPSNSSTLDARSSTDADGTISSYAWTQTAGPSTATITNAGTSVATASGLVQGTYTFKVVVTDNLGATASASKTVTVNAATAPAPSPTNQAPVANAGANQTITLPTSEAGLNGSASSDPDGSIASFMWSQTSGPNTSSLTGKGTPYANAAGLIAGTYTFKLTITDNLGATASASVTVVVNTSSGTAPVPAPAPAPAPAPSPTNQAPIANAGTNQTITLPTSEAALNGRASSDPDGTIASYMWAQTSGPSTSALTGKGTSYANAAGLIAGTYTFRLTVTDNMGAASSASVTVVVNPLAGTAPVPAPSLTNKAPIANAGTNQTITLPTSEAGLNGRASSDPDGAIASFMWAQTSGPNASALTGKGTSYANAAGLVEGTYTFRLTVTDNQGAYSTASVTVVVIPPPPSAPVPNTTPLDTTSASVNQAPIIKTSDTLTVSSGALNTLLNASQSYDPDGVITRYSWNFKKGPREPRVFNPDSSNTIIANLVTGTYEFVLTVTDDDGAKSSKDVVVKVLNSGKRIFIPTISMYPNPAVSNVHITIDTEARGRTTLTLFDVSGRAVMTEVFAKDTDSFTKIIDVSRLNKGVYSVVVQVEQSEKVAKLLIKQ